METDYFPISPLGKEPADIEAFGSIFCRMAIAHSVSIYALTMHLRKWWHRQNPSDTRAKINVINSLNPMFCGIGANVSAYLEIVSAATGCTGLVRTTFLPLRNVLGSNGVGLVRDGRAWCPACHVEDAKSGGTVYDRLLWAIPVVSRCPIHRIALALSCGACGALQPRYHHLGRIDLCCRCKQPLCSPAGSWTRAPSPPLFEKECVELVSELSSGKLRVVENAWETFIQEFSIYMEAIGKKVSKYAYGAPRRPQIQREKAPPRFSTLIRRCAAFGVNPAHLISDPIDAAKSACIFEFARLEIPSERKPLRPIELLSALRARFLDELNKPVGHFISSPNTIAKEFGVSMGFLNYRLPEEVSKLTAHRKASNQLMVKVNQDAAVSFLLAGPVLDYPSSRYPSHDHLVSAVVTSHGLGVHRARQAVGVALKSKLGDRLYKSYRKASALHKPRAPAG